MNLLSDFEAHKRDEAFDREDAKHRRHPTVTHAEKVAFADAMMADTTTEDEDETETETETESEEEHHE